MDHTNLLDGRVVLFFYLLWALLDIETQMVDLDDK